MPRAASSKFSHSVAYVLRAILGHDEHAVFGDDHDHIAHSDDAHGHFVFTDIVVDD
jgi:hypothetical protein